jgi:MFS transporter, DHA2 family, multidrug resistance protein
VPTLNAITSSINSPPAAAIVDPATLPNTRKYLIFAVMAFGQFMALIDIQIVAASLNDIQAGLSAAPEEISWIQTGYLIAELVMIPLTAFLSQALSTRWLFVASAALFTIASVLCGMAWDIESLIVFRVVQGFVGGAMVPLVFATGFIMFSGPQRAMIPAILGMVSVLAPTLGPTAGGWLTDLVGWRSIFYINVVPGLAITVLAASLIRVDRPKLSMLRRIDYTHVLSMALFLGALQYVLEEGPRREWFSEPEIAIAAWLSAVAFALFLERSLRSGDPIVRLSPFRRPTFVFACTFNFVIGFGLYASTYLIPVFLGQVRNFTSLQIGATVFVTGIAQILSTLIAARLSQHVDPRKTITIGLILFSTSLWLTSFITPDWGFEAFLLPQALRGFSLMLCIVPSVGMALNGFDAIELRHASALFNLMRNLGGALGIAVVDTWLQDQARIHLARLSESLGEAGRHAAEMIMTLSAYIGQHVADPQLALLMAQVQFEQLVVIEASALAFGEVFRIMSWIFLVALIMVPFCRPIMNAPRVKPAAH